MNIRFGGCKALFFSSSEALDTSWLTCEEQDSGGAIGGAACFCEVLCSVSDLIYGDDVILFGLSTYFSQIFRDFPEPTPVPPLLVAIWWLRYTEASKRSRSGSSEGLGLCWEWKRELLWLIRCRRPRRRLRRRRTIDQSWSLWEKRYRGRVEVAVFSSMWTWLAHLQLVHQGQAAMSQKVKPSLQDDWWLCLCFLFTNRETGVSVFDPRRSGSFMWIDLFGHKSLAAKVPIIAAYCTRSKAHHACL